MADNSMIAVARPDSLSLGDVKLEDKQSVPAENKLAELEAMIVTQVEFYFSAENLPQDQFLLGQLKIGGDNKVALNVVTKFNKMRKLLMKLAKLNGSEGMNSTNSLHRVLAAASSPHLSLSDDGTRIGSSAPAPEVPSDNERFCTVEAYCLPREATIDSIREQFSACGVVRSVRIPNEGADHVSSRTSGPSAEVEFESVDSAFRACETLTDTKNWRGGQRVTLRENMTVDAARRLLAKTGAKTKKAKASNASSAEGPVVVPETLDQKTDGTPSDAPLEGRQKGTVLSLKGHFGFIAPDKAPGGRAKRAEDNLYFKTKQLAGIAVGSAVEYEASRLHGKWNAVNVVVLPSVSSSSEPSERGGSSVEVRPESSRPKLLAKQVRMASGPDATLGFTEGWRPVRGHHGFGAKLNKASSSSSTSLDGDAAEWAPSY